MPIPKLTPVKSTNIDAIAHEGDTLHVRFKNQSHVYRYEGVPAALHQELLEAKSPGAVFHGKIRGRYDFTKLEPDDEPPPRAA